MKTTGLLSLLGNPETGSSKNLRGNWELFSQGWWSLQNLEPKLRKGAKREGGGIRLWWWGKLFAVFLNYRPAYLNKELGGRGGDPTGRGRKEGLQN